MQCCMGAGTFALDAGVTQVKVCECRAAGDGRPQSQGSGRLERIAPKPQHLWQTCAGERLA